MNHNYKKLNYSVLLVDDEPLIRLALRTLISNSGLPLVVTGEEADGIDALRFIQLNQKIDIVIIDMKMPVMNGIDFLKKLNEWKSQHILHEAPVCIVLSAFSDYDLVRESFVLGAIDYIVKVDLDKRIVVPLLKKTIDMLG